MKGAWEMFKKLWKQRFVKIMGIEDREFYAKGI